MLLLLFHISDSSRTKGKNSSVVLKRFYHMTAHIVAIFTQLCVLLPVNLLKEEFLMLTCQSLWATHGLGIIHYRSPIMISSLKTVNAMWMSCRQYSTKWYNFRKNGKIEEMIHLNDIHHLYQVTGILTNCYVCFWPVLVSCGENGHYVLAAIYPTKRKLAIVNSINDTRQSQTISNVSFKSKNVFCLVLWSHQTWFSVPAEHSHVIEVLKSWSGWHRPINIELDELFCRLSETNWK